MIKVCGINYIIRIKEENEIKTLKFKDFESMLYIMNKLQKEKQDYVIIKYDDLHNNIIETLLDYKECD